MPAFTMQLAVPEPIPPGQARHTFYWTEHGLSSFSSTHGPGLGGLGPVAQPNIDFVRLAAGIFAADRTTLRTGGGSNWNQRVIDLTIPMNDPATWQALDDDLSGLFGFLTGDRWTFHFTPGPEMTEPVAERKPAPVRVVLLSGGADSAIGALLSRSQLTPDEHHVLVSHVGLTNLAPIQQRVAGRIVELLPGPGQSHVQVTFSRRNRQPDRTRLPSEPSSRSRSALFLSLGLAVASIDHVPLWIPENGFASLNPPLGPERRGSLSTRTTHPMFLEMLGQLLRRAGAHADIHNPFTADTKALMFTRAAGLVGSEAASQLLSSTHSCGMTGQRAFGIPATQQCGVCFGCVVRRASFAASELHDTTTYIDPVADPRLPRWLAERSVERSVQDLLRRGIRSRDLAALNLPPGYPASQARALCAQAITELAVLFP